VRDVEQKVGVVKEYRLKGRTKRPSELYFTIALEDGSTCAAFVPSLVPYHEKAHARLIVQKSFILGRNRCRFIQYVD